MADEEKNDVTEETPQDEAAESAAADSPSPDDAPATDESADAPESADAAPAAAAEEGGAFSPRQKRKHARSHKNRRPRFTGSPEERLAQKTAYRKKKAAQRRAFRLKRREAHKAAGPRVGTSTVVKEPGTKKIQQGTVVSDKNDKTIIVAIEVMESHRMYRKVVRSTKKLTAHDAKNDANEGDVVRVMECRPMSRTKRWRLVEVVERAK